MVNLNCDKGAKDIQEGNSSFLNKQCWRNYIPICKRISKAGPLPYAIYKKRESKAYICVRGELLTLSMGKISIK